MLINACKHHAYEEFGNRSRLMFWYVYPHYSGSVLSGQSPGVRISNRIHNSTVALCTSGGLALYTIAYKIKIQFADYDDRHLVKAQVHRIH